MDGKYLIISDLDKYKDLRMKKILLLLAVVFTLTACEKNEDGLKNSLQLSLKSCVLDNEHSYPRSKN